MPAQEGKESASLLTIFITVFIDLLGIGIIIPVIPALFFEPSSGFFSEAIPELRRNILYGLLIGIYPFMQFFGAPVLGALSDRHGRRPMLTISLFGTMLGYILFAVAIEQELLWLLFVSRALPGFTGGNIAIIFSSISDVSEGASRASNFGLVGMAFGLGFILGPTIGGVLADSTVVSWFNPATPFWFTSGLTFLNIVLVQLRFKETLKYRRDSRVSLFTGMQNLALSFQMPNLRRIFPVVLLLSLGFTFFTQFFSVKLIQEFSYTEKDIGLLYGWIGIWMAGTQGILVRRLARYIPSADVITVSMVLRSVALFLILLPAEGYMFYILTPLIAVSQGMTGPNLTAVVSEQATPDQQGQVLGINQSMQSIGQAVPPVIAGYFNSINGNLPIITAGIITFLAWAVYMVFFWRKRKKEYAPKTTSHSES